MLFGFVPIQIRGFDRSLLLIPIRKIDQTRALRAEHVQAQA